MQRTTFGWLALLALIGIPLIEIALFIVVGREIGVWPTIGLVVATAIAGSALIRVRGLAVLEQARDQLERGEPPVANMFHALGIVVAGVLLLTPGFLTDAIGFLLLVPAVRRWLGLLIWTRLRARGDGSVVVEEGVIDGEFTRVDEPAPARPDRRLSGPGRSRPGRASPWRRGQ